jgi:hypothetical protein
MERDHLAHIQLQRTPEGSMAHLPISILLPVALFLGCNSPSGSGARDARADEVTRGAPEVRAVHTAHERVAIAMSLTVSNAAQPTQTFNASGAGQCYHHRDPAAHAGIEWDVAYRREDNPGLRSLVMQVMQPARVANDTSRQVDVSLDAGDAMRLINGSTVAKSLAGGPNDTSRARVTIAERGQGALLTLEGVFADGARITGTITCKKLIAEP